MTHQLFTFHIGTWYTPQSTENHVFQFQIEYHGGNRSWYSSTRQKKSTPWNNSSSINTKEIHLPWARPIHTFLQPFWQLLFWMMIHYCSQELSAAHLLACIVPVCLYCFLNNWFSLDLPLLHYNIMFRTVPLILQLLHMVFKHNLFTSCPSAQTAARKGSITLVLPSLLWNTVPAT